MNAAQDTTYEPLPPNEPMLSASKPPDARNVTADYGNGHYVRTFQSYAEAPSNMTSTSYPPIALNAMADIPHLSGMAIPHHQRDPHLLECHPQAPIVYTVLPAGSQIITLQSHTMALNLEHYLPTPRSQLQAHLTVHPLASHYVAQPGPTPMGMPESDPRSAVGKSAYPASSATVLQMQQLPPGLPIGPAPSLASSTPNQPLTSRTTIPKAAVAFRSLQTNTTPKHLTRISGEDSHQSPSLLSTHSCERSPELPARHPSCERNMSAAVQDPPRTPSRTYSSCSKPDPINERQNDCEAVPRKLLPSQNTRGSYSISDPTNKKAAGHVSNRYNKQLSDKGEEDDGNGSATPALYRSRRRLSSSLFPIKRDRRELPKDFRPSRQSVVIGKGRTIATMPGNVRLGKLVDSFVPLYTKCSSKTDRTNVVTEILQMMYSDCPNGAFVRREADGRWYEVGDGVARVKIGAMLRDRLPNQYRSCTSVRVAKRRAKHCLSQVYEKANGDCDSGPNKNKVGGEEDDGCTDSEDDLMAHNM